MSNEIKKVEQGKFLEYAPVKKTGQDNKEYIQHTFVFEISSGITEVTMANDEYIEGVLNKFNVSTIELLVEMLKQQVTPLYFIDSENFIGYSFTEGFKSNNYPKKMGTNVLITGVEDSLTNVCIELEDGTIANRRFTVKVKNADGTEEYKYNVVKRLKFIESLGLKVDKFTFDLNTLVGMTMDYVIASVGTNSYLQPIEVHPQTNATDFLNSLPQ